MSEPSELDSLQIHNSTLLMKSPDSSREVGCVQFSSGIGESAAGARLLSWRQMSSASKSATASSAKRDSLSFDPFLLLEVADVVNATLDLDELLQRVAQLVQKMIHYDIFAILLREPKSDELRIRFSVGHPQEVAQKFRMRVGQGI